MYLDFVVHDDLCFRTNGSAFSFHKKTGCPEFQAVGFFDFFSCPVNLSI